MLYFKVCVITKSSNTLIGNNNKYIRLTKNNCKNSIEFCKNEDLLQIGQQFDMVAI